MNSFHTLKKCLCLTSLVILTAAFPQIGYANKLYKWVDKNGKVSYQSSPPPANSKILKESTLKTTQNVASSSSKPNNSLDNPQVIVYTVANCPACSELMSHLKKMGVPYSEKSLANREVQTNVLRVTGKLTAPTIAVGGKFLSDNSPKALKKQLVNAGYKFSEPETESKPNTLEESPEKITP